MSLLNIFVGAPQSKYAAIAIVVALIFVAFAMLFGKEQVPVGQKFLFVLVMFIVALPTVLMTLFQLTCLVTGAGIKNQRWWCAAYAWIGTIFIILYSVIVVVVGIAALMNGSNVLSDINNMMTFEQMEDLANQQAAEYFQSSTAPMTPKHTPPGIPKEMAPFTVGGTAAPPAHAEPSIVKDKPIESFEVPEPVPAPTEADKSLDKMQKAAIAPAPIMPDGLENFADFPSMIDYEKKKNEMFIGGNKKA
jgi:hypothetical protein